MSDIKLFAGYYVYFQENLSDSDKITFFNFIKESTENQVSHLLITGKMVSEEILQETILLLEDWRKDLMFVIETFKGDSADEASDALGRLLKKAKSIGFERGKTQGMITMGGVVVAALAVTLAFKVYKNYLSKAARACKGKKGVEKQQCMRIAKMNARKEKIMTLTKVQGLCKNTKQPEKCVAKLKLKIAKEKIKMKKIKY